MQSGFITDPPVVVGIATCTSISRSVTPDQQSSLIGVFDEINLPQFPILFQFAIVTWITSVVNEFHLQIRIVRPMADMTEQSQDFGPPMVIAKTKPGGVTMAMTITGIVFSGPGRYEIRAFGNNAILSQRPLLVNQIAMNFSQTSERPQST